MSTIILRDCSKNIPHFVADSSTATGLKWATPAGGGMTLLDTLTLSGSSVTSATFSSAYTALVIYIKNVQNSSNSEFRLRLNSDTANNYAWVFINNATEQAASSGTSYARVGNVASSSGALQKATQIITLMRPSDTDQVFITTTAQYFDSTIQNFHCTGVYDNSAAITSITLAPGSGTMSAGTVLIYGVN